MEKHSVGGEVFGTCIILREGDQIEGLDSDKERGRATGENRNENAAVDILGVSLKDKERNEVIRRTLGVACNTDKIREARLRWYGHVAPREDETMKRIMTAEVNRYGGRSRGRQKKRWGHMIQQDMKSPIKERTYC